MHSDVEAKQLRTFGLMVGAAFGILGAWPTLVRGETPRLWALGIAGLLIITALLMPQSLRPVHRVWMAGGHVLGRVNTAIILTVVFYGLFTPMGLVMRLLGKDPMHRRFEPNDDTYRVVRRPRPSSHMNRQF